MSVIVPERSSTQQASGPILVVEDDPVTGRLLEKALAGTNRSVRLATSAAAAVEVIALVTPSLIVLDLVLPDVDGRLLLGKWRSAPATARVSRERSKSTTKTRPAATAGPAYPP